MPKLFPIHQILTFDIETIRNRIKCLTFNDQTECLNIEIQRCEILGKTSEDFEKCMIKLDLEKNATLWCENHYNDATLWVDNLSPRYL